MRHGARLPQDSYADDWRRRGAAFTTQWGSSLTIAPPDPAMDRAAASASASVVTSSIDSGSTGAEDPPGQKTLTLRPSGGPPARSMITWRKVLPNSTS